MTPVLPVIPPGARPDAQPEGSRLIIALAPDPAGGRLPIPEEVILDFQGAGWLVASTDTPVDPSFIVSDSQPAVILMALQRIEPALREEFGRLRDGPASVRPLVVALGGSDTAVNCADLLDAVADLAFPVDASAEWIRMQVGSVLDLLAPPCDRDVISLGSITLNPAIKRLRVVRDGRRRETALSPTECRIVAVMMARPFRALDRDELLRSVWGVDCLIDPRTVDVHIRRLRGALARVGCEAMLQTVRGVGYRLAPD
jgi:two-component system phosphate regulon response regulator PhoB